MSVPFLHFPSSIQHEIVRNMNLRELVKFSFCSKRTNKIVKSAKISLSKVLGFLENGRLYVNMTNTTDDYYEICINPRHSDDVLSKNQDVLEVTDKAMGHLKDLFVYIRDVSWTLRPTNPQSQVILQKHFPKLNRLDVIPTKCPNQRRRITKEDITFFLEQFEVTDVLRINSEAEEGHVYSKGFQQNTVFLKNPSWMHWDAIINSTSESIELSNVQNLFSGDLNRLLKLWVSNEKMQRLGWLRIKLDSIDGLEFPPDFMELVLEGIEDEEMEDEIDELDPELSNNFQTISRIDGTIATVRVEDNEFCFEID